MGRGCRGRLGGRRGGCRLRLKMGRFVGLWLREMGGGLWCGGEGEGGGGWGGGKAGEEEVGEFAEGAGWPGVDLEMGWEVGLNGGGGCGGVRGRWRGEFVEAVETAGFVEEF